MLHAVSDRKPVNRVNVTDELRFMAFRNMSGIFFASAGAEPEPAMPIIGTVSIEFRGDLIFIGGQFSL